ncbi:MAG: C40 family peptidase [Schwartzia sp.]|nr:C40 family peptidase [Schwartzia sp. (in: firmicutes)]
MAPKIIATGRKYTGVPYSFGGTTPKGFDCSGFVQFVFRQHGYAIPRMADEQYHLGKKVKKRKELVPGDLVFFSTYEPGASHCGIYLGQNKFLHVSSRRGVRVDNLDDEYWKPRWYGGRHIVK